MSRKDLGLKNVIQKRDLNQPRMSYKANVPKGYSIFLLWYQYRAATYKIFSFALVPVNFRFRSATISCKKWIFFDRIFVGNPVSPVIDIGGFNLFRLRGREEKRNEEKKFEGTYTFSDSHSCSHFCLID